MHSRQAILFLACLFVVGGAARAQDPTVAPLSRAPAELLASDRPSQGAACWVYGEEWSALGDAALSSKWFENLSVYGGLDGSKAPEDLGANANFGVRGAVQWGLPLWESAGLGLQLGTAVNLGLGAVGVFPALGGPDERTQSFSTVGVFQRTDWGLRWGLAYDFLHESYYDNFDLGQWRSQLGYGATPIDELGCWIAWAEHGDRASAFGRSFRLDPILQANLFWRHVWREDIVSRMWAGIAEEHVEQILVLPGARTIKRPVVFGADLFIPLNSFLAIFGEANFITPTDSGTVVATLGIAIFPGKSASQASNSRFSPYFPLANNTSFAVDAKP